MNLKSLGHIFGYALCIFLTVLPVGACLDSSAKASRINEVKATDALREIREAQKMFKQQWRRYGSLKEIGLNLLEDNTATTVNKSGYKYELTLSENGYKVLATPVQFKVTGSWAFYLDETGVIRGSAIDGQTVNSNDIPIKNQ